MRLAILSDIHSNLEALEACQRQAHREGAEAYMCLGDMTGYGADPAATLDEVMALPGLLAVRGNHDEALLSTDYAGVNNSLKNSTAWTRDLLSDRHLEFLRSLPYLHEAYGATFAHASAANPASWDYLSEDWQMLPCMDAAHTNVTFIGHMHIPKVFYETKPGQIRELKPKEGIGVHLSIHTRYVINVGSVGQPRDGDSAACFVIYDDEAREVSFHRVVYNLAETARKILAADLNPDFAERLSAAY